MEIITFRNISIPGINCIFGAKIHFNANRIEIERVILDKKTIFDQKSEVFIQKVKFSIQMIQFSIERGQFSIITENVAVVTT